MRNPVLTPEHCAEQEHCASCTAMPAFSGAVREASAERTTADVLNLDPVRSTTAAVECELMDGCVAAILKKVKEKYCLLSCVQLVIVQVACVMPLLSGFSSCSCTIGLFECDANSGTSTSTVVLYTFELVQAIDTSGNMSELRG
jgi:hypothetical protein